MRGRSKVVHVGGDNVHIPSFITKDDHYPLQSGGCVTVEIRGKSIVIKSIKCEPEKEERRKK